MHVLRRHSSIVPVVRPTARGSGLRRFDAYRDLGTVVDLIEVAFGEKLGPVGRYALAETRRFARYGWLIWALLHPFRHNFQPAPGFVWIEDGRIVGNVSVRRACEWGGFLIGNVAVHPDLQGRGIGTALMEAALADVAAHRGRWVGLEVRSDNDVARRLYEKFGFRAVGEKVCMLRHASVPWDGGVRTYPGLRPGRSRDARIIAGMVRATIPDAQRALLEFREGDYMLGWERALDCWLDGRRETWWVAESSGVIQGALRAVHELSQRPDRMEIVVHPAYRGRVETSLIQKGLDTLHGPPKKAIEVSIVDPIGSTVAAFEQAGFCKFQVLVQMRLSMGHRIPVGHL